MNKNLFFISVFAFIAIFLSSCDSGEKKLLEPKVYFENKEYQIEVEDQNEITYDLRARLSKMTSEVTTVTYSLATESDIVTEYNKRNGTNYELFDLSNVKIDNERTNIPVGALYAENRLLQISNLNAVQEGKSYLLPIRIQSASLPVIDGTDIAYFVLRKPVRILRATKLENEFIRVPFLPTTPFKSVTYEALIYVNFFGSNNTIMGKEGTLIFRIGDMGGGLPRDEIQIAGSKQYQSTKKFQKDRWYHVAFTYDQPSGKTAIFINGVKSAESTWDAPGFNLSGEGSGGFFIGKVARFMWGERPFYGQMSEVRVWNAARTENQIQQNMLSVDPKTEGLLVYYKLNGVDQYQKDGKWYVKNASGDDMDGLVNDGLRKLDVVTLENPIRIN
ncbi:DUF1735 and LamG domain-containing protein [Bacteroides pyogenes]|uniref:Patatin-like protein n=2 Tax=Bacteroides pyogenes TaxID=310300 RepID=W4PD06_9BACE|nr:DUF1735 and LamG domain-containing protein [Bacteroides pyogenes]GAE14499.1 patatin-like protein [Bacteroides pyogenes JCM 6292]MBR8725684.1 hypothetical protein [Bacteroides pyogenes]MBR8738964.1 hypothetical protein [Bacteroides pyogenes]MBR8754757.1 hypothetical protein [Bacteroides pyogenes]MBR8796154.1 hypothetical protein [Bacteroides pyogenes]